MTGKAYVAIRPCGCMCFAAAEERAKESRVAHEIAACLREGLRIERVTNEQVRENPWGCPICRTSEDSSANEETASAV